jgi:tripartite-type tricarboxylate transporter receptor subunit TctC
VGFGLAAIPAAADDVADFYRGKTITITSAGGAGGGYGVYALLLSEHLDNYIPGQPKVIVNYMPGAGGVKAANYEFNVSPKDGTSILAPLQSMATLQLLDKKGVRYDASKFVWIGRMAETTSGFVVRRSVAKDLDQLKARKTPIVVGVTQPGAPNQIMAALVPYCTGIKEKQVSGYKGSAPTALAFTRHEVDGVALPLDSLRLVYTDMLKETFIAQSGLARSSYFPNTPLVLDLCKDPAKKKIVEVFQVEETMGRSYAAPPGTPAARGAALRHAFDEAMKDKDLLANATERKLEVGPLAGVAIQKIVEKHIATGSDVVAAAKKAVGLK